MDMRRAIRLQPTLEMIAEHMVLSGWNCRLHLAGEDRQYRGIRLYHHNQQLQEDMLYLLRPQETRFPVDTYSYLCAVPKGGKANHLICPGQPDEVIMDSLMEIFFQFQRWEDDIGQLIYRGAGLQDLCELGAQLLENPVCIHDDWFVMMAATKEFFEIMEPEYLMTSEKGFVPSAVVEDFRDDSDYLETYTHHDAQIWTQQDQNQLTLYVNLWDGPIYKGRLLVGRKNRDFRKSDFLVAEMLTQQALMMLRRRRMEDQMVYRNMDDIVFSLLQGTHSNPTELGQLLKVLNWNRDDRFACILLKSQQSNDGAMMEQLLHRALFRVFPGAYVLLGTQEQCVVCNLSQNKMELADIRRLLAPLCRDYCQYAGISSPASGILELQGAYYQAGAALRQAFLLRSDKWILRFSDCAMDHILLNLPSPMTAGSLVAPELEEMMAYDKENGTQYFETFREYLLQERDIPRTSEKLIIHRTTLLYRLKKIQSLFPMDLEDPWQRMYLMMSLWILEKERT